MCGTCSSFDLSACEKPQRLRNHIWLPFCLSGGSKSHIYGNGKISDPGISVLNKTKLREKGEEKISFGK